MVRILVVDDDVDVGNTIVAMLAGVDFEVVLESDPWHIQKTLSVEAFDLVISDIFMPEFDGFELVQKVKEINPLTRVLLMTGGTRHFPSGSRALTELTDSSEFLGANGVISKPFRKQELIDQVRKLL